MLSVGLVVDVAVCVIAGYVETTTICEEIILLSASGTAAIVNIDLSQHHLKVLNSGGGGVHEGGAKRGE